MIFSNYRRTVIAGAFLSVFFVAAPLVFIQSAAPAKRALDRACMQKVSAARDSAIMTALDASAASLKAGLQKRSDKVFAGWGMENQTDRRTALKMAWEDWKKTVKASRAGLATGRVQAWKQFQTDRAACGTGAEADERSAQGAIDSGL
ncbi:MAG: hypothetical protein WAP52_03460 [Candidatus Sungiibacteriota bacterium]